MAGFDVPVVVIEYQSEYGDAPAKQTDANAGEVMTASMQPVLTSNYVTHAGWYTTSTFEADTKAIAGETVIPSSDMVLYAKWVSDLAVIDDLTLVDLGDSVRRIYSSSDEMTVAQMTEQQQAVPFADDIGY